MKQPSLSAAFSLVELSIVLVILGLLTGGILAGQSLIRAAELRSVSTQIQNVKAVSRTFQDKYLGLPGDLRNATAFWGAATCPGTLGTTTVTTTTCNGDGDGVIEFASASSTGSYENFRLWQQLANAGLIEGAYSGVPAAGGERGATIGVNSLAGKISNSGISIESVGDLPTGDTWRWPGSYSNMLYVGGVSSTAHPLESPIFRPEETWNIDMKMDDGNPATGMVRSHRQVGVWVNCTTTNVASTTAYNLTDSSMACALLFPKAI